MTRFRLTRAFCGRRDLFAPVAAVAGWFAVLPANREPILVYYRQLGVAVGVVGAALAVWAWKRPWEDPQGRNETSADAHDDRGRLSGV